MMDLIYENDSVSTGLVATASLTTTKPITNYKFIIMQSVVVGNSSPGQTICHVVLYNTTYNFRITSNSGSGYSMRSYTFTDETTISSLATGTSGSEAARYILVPYLIYGVK